MIKILLIVALLCTRCMPAFAKVPQPKKCIYRNVYNTFSKRDVAVIHNAVDFIKDKEGFTPVLIPDFNKKIYIIGYGDHTCKKRYKSVANITQWQAEECLVETTTKIYVKLKQSLPNLRNNQYAALISLVFTVGFDDFYKSRTYRLVKNKASKRMAIKAEWLDFNRVNGKRLCGLTSRRLAEYELFSF